MVRYAVGLPNVGPFADAPTLVELAVTAEERDWDGVFLWDHLLYHDPDWPVVNPISMQHVRHCQLACYAASRRTSYRSQSIHGSMLHKRSGCYQAWCG